MSVTAGIDEVGRGALAGPVVVGAFVLKEGTLPAILEEAGVKILKDSKKLTAKQRERIYEAARFSSAWSFGMASPAEIDELGLTAAITLAAGRAVDMLRQLGETPDNILADAGLFHGFEETIPTERFVKGDELYPEISLASIMAKVTRDRMMQELDMEYPDYEFLTNVGYGSAIHLKALKEKGATPIHRKLFLRKLNLEN